MAENPHCSNCTRLYHKLAAALNEIQDLEGQIIRLRASGTIPSTQLANRPDSISGQCFVSENQSLYVAGNMSEPDPLTPSVSAVHMLRSRLGKSMEGHSGLPDPFNYNGNSAGASNSWDSDSDMSDLTNGGISGILENLKLRTIQDFLAQWNQRKIELFRELQKFISEATPAPEVVPAVVGKKNVLKENEVELVRGSGIFMKESQLKECMGQPKLYDVRTQIRNILMALIPEEELAHMSISGVKARNDAPLKQKLPRNILNAITRFFDLTYGIPKPVVLATIKNKLNNIDKKYKRAAGFREKQHDSDDDSHDAGLLQV